MDTKITTAPPVNTYVRATPTDGYVCQRADQKRRYPNRDLAVLADQAILEAWNGLKAGLVAVRGRRFHAETHDLTGDCRVYSGDVLAHGRSVHVAIFRRVHDGAEGETIAVQITVNADDAAAQGLIDFWSAHPRETHLVDQAIAAADVFRQTTAEG
ncbi:MAG: hypothetical protein HY696_04810 [Deltaproteobacteria bacterium]|nr:hypothetical protein [Deltaproteobacteria bacterium]